MFVDIVSPKKPLEAEKLFRACWRKGEEITPEICLEVLKSTNFVTCMKRMLLCVERVPASRQAAFKEVVLAVFERREQPQSVKEVGERLAKAQGYEAEFSVAAGKRHYEHGEYFFASAPDVVRFESVWIKDFSIHGTKVGKNLYFAHLGDIDLTRLDFAGVERIRLAGGEQIDFSKSKNLPEVIDLSGYDRVVLDECDLSTVKEIKLKEKAKLSLHHARNIPRGTEFFKCKDIDFMYADLSTIGNLRFFGNDFVAFLEVNKFPEKMAFANCGLVSLVECDLTDVKELCLTEIKRANLCDMKNQPARLDLSTTDEVDLCGCDLSKMTEIALKDGGKLTLGTHQIYDSENDYPPLKLYDVVDLSKPGEVRIRYSKIGNDEKTVFKEGARVEFDRCVLPKDLDVSMCEAAAFLRCGFGQIKNLKLNAVGTLEVYECGAFPKCFGTDFSGYDAVDFTGNDFLGVTGLKFKAGADVCLLRAKNLPEDLDVSMADKVNFNFCEFSKFDGLRFKAGAEVSFCGVQRLPKVLDVSGCRAVNLKKCSLEGVESITFADRKQLEASGCDVPLFEGGKIKFANGDTGSTMGLALKQLFRGRE